FAAPTTAADPNVREWATSDLERRHAFLATVTLPIASALELGVIGRLTSGAPFTPVVGSDINGDGARNDRAFIFVPATAPDTAVGNAMRTLIADAPGAVRRCLVSQLARVAARNSCAGPWQPSFDLQLSWRPAWFGLERRLTLSVLTVNLMGGLAEWLPGPSTAGARQSDRANHVIPRLARPLRGTGRGAARDRRLARRAEPKHAAGAPARPCRAHARAVAQGPRSAQVSGGSLEGARMRPTADLPDDPRLPGLMAIRDSGLARAIPALGLEQGGGGAEPVLCGYHPGA